MRVSRVSPPRTLSAGMVVVHHDGERYRILAIRSGERWEFPVASVAEGDDPLETAEAEVFTRTGISELALDWGDEYRETVPFPDGRVSRYYLAESASDRVTPGATSATDRAATEHRWVTAEEAEEILPPRLAIVLDWALARLASGPLKH